MNKHICILLALLLTTSLLACSSDQGAVTQTPNDDIRNDDIVIHAIKSLDELNEHQNTCSDLPENFVSYTPLQPFGAFVRYQYSYPQRGFYVLADANGHEISFAIRYPGSGDIARGQTLNMEDSMTDMRTHPSGVAGCIYRDGIDYLYADEGKLVRICWEIGDIVFVLDLHREAGLYPLDGEITPITKLLSTDIDVAYSVVEELAERLAQ